jgi:hypothetical protein
MTIQQILLGVSGQAPPAPWSPLSLSPGLWLDVSNLSSLTINGSNQISQWSDLSGNTRHVTQGQLALMPTLNGGAVVFSGGQSLGNTAYDVTGLDDLTILLVSNPSTSVSPTQQSIVRFQSAPNPYLAYPWATGKLISHADSGTGGPSAGLISGSTNVSVARRKRNDAAGLSTRNNGTAVGSTTSSNTTIAAGPLSVGSWNGVAEYYTGSIREIIIVHSALILEDQEKAEGYLAWKWGAQANLPLVHPYRNAPP